MDSTSSSVINLLPESQSQNFIEANLNCAGLQNRVTNATVSFITEEMETVSSVGPENQTLAQAVPTKQQDQDYHPGYVLYIPTRQIIKHLTFTFFASSSGKLNYCNFFFLFLVQVIHHLEVRLVK